MKTPKHMFHGCLRLKAQVLVEEQTEADAGLGGLIMEIG